MERRDSIYEFRAVILQLLLQIVHNNTLLVHFNFYNLSLMQLESLNRAEKRRRLYEDYIAGIYERLTHKVYSLRRTRKRYQLVHLRLEALFLQRFLYFVQQIVRT